MSRWHLRRLYRRVGWVIPVAVAVACWAGAWTLTKRGADTGAMAITGTAAAGLGLRAVPVTRKTGSRSVSVAYHRPRHGHSLAYWRYWAKTNGHQHQLDHAHVQRLLRQLERVRHVQAHVETPQEIIRRVFGAHGDEAVRVAYCETGGTYSPAARNGEHLGLFQMGAWERQTYGDAWDVEGQARAAYRYFAATGKTWGPWECKP